MDALLTTCTAEKSPAPGLLPARVRYRGWRIEDAVACAEAAGLPLLFLSGVYGIIAADHPLPWYDHALRDDEVAAMVAPSAGQLGVLGVSALTARLLPPETPGWAPYHRLLHAACLRAGVGCRVVLLPPR